MNDLRPGIYAVVKVEIEVHTDQSKTLHLEIETRDECVTTFEIPIPS